MPARETSTDEQLRDAPALAATGVPAVEAAVVGEGAADDVVEIDGEEIAVKKRKTGPGFGFWLAVAWIGLLVLLALTAPILPLKDYDQSNFSNVLQKPFTSWSEPLGTDQLGRSELSRVIWGARVSLGIGFFSVGIGIVVGTAIGVMTGYFRGPFDRVVSVFADATIAFPPLVLLLAMVTIFQRNMVNIGLALAILIVPSFFRLARANTFVLAERDYVTAAKVMGAGRARILLKEIVPNVALTLLAYAPVVIALVIIAEGSLAFLSLSLPPPQPSWGGMINDGRTKLDTALHLTYVPGTVMVLTVLAFNWIGRGLHSVYDPRQGVL
jgi:peptide/nickel transport system permease protein